MKIKKISKKLSQSKENVIKIFCLSIYLSIVYSLKSQGKLNLNDIEV